MWSLSEQKSAWDQIRSPKLTVDGGFLVVVAEGVVDTIRVDGISRVSADKDGCWLWLEEACDLQLICSDDASDEEAFTTHRAWAKTITSAMRERLGR